MLYRFRQRRRLLKKKSVKTQTAVLTILSCIKRTGRSTSLEGLIPARPYLVFTFLQWLDLSHLAPAWSPLVYDALSLVSLSSKYALEPKPLWLPYGHKTIVVVTSLDQELLEVLGFRKPFLGELKYYVTFYVCYLDSYCSRLWCIHSLSLGIPSISPYKPSPLSIELEWSNKHNNS